MKLLTGAAALTTLAAGIGGGTFAYVNTASGVAATPAHVERAVGAAGTSTSSTAAPKATVAKRPVRIRVRFRPCPAGARVEHGVCVRHVVHTVVVPAPVVAPSTTRVTTATTQVCAGCGGGAGPTHPAHHAHAALPSDAAPGQPGSSSGEPGGPGGDD